MNKVIIVDENDRIVKFENKERAHKGNGMLHRAILVMVFNKKEILLARRSRYKKLWPLFWDGSCASHPLPNETYLQCAKRRLKEELGIKCKLLKYLFKFKYKAIYKNIGTENEICKVFICNYNGDIQPNKKGVSEIKWESINKLKNHIKKNSNKYTPWFKIAFTYLKTQSAKCPLQRSEARPALLLEQK